MASRSQLRQWFQTGDKPTQQQFYEFFESFWHKTDDELPIAAIKNLSTVLSQKVSKEYVDQLFVALGQPYINWDAETNFQPGLPAFIKVYNAQLKSHVLYLRTAVPLPGIAPYLAPATDTDHVYYEPVGGSGNGGSSGTTPTQEEKISFTPADLVAGVLTLPHLAVSIPVVNFTLPLRSGIDYTVGPYPTNKITFHITDWDLEDSGEIVYYRNLNVQAPGGGSIFIPANWMGAGNPEFTDAEAGLKWLLEKTFTI